MNDIRQCWIMVASLLGGLWMFLLSAGFYPHLGLPPLWLVGLPMIGFTVVVAWSAINDIRGYRE